MEFSIKTYQNDEGVFAEVFSKGKSICIGDGESPYKAIQDACSVLSDIMAIAEEEENNEIINIISERDKKDDEIRYTLDEVIKLRKNN